MELIISQVISSINSKTYWSLKTVYMVPQALPNFSPSIMLAAIVSAKYFWILSGTKIQENSHVCNLTINDGSGMFLDSRSLLQK